MEQAGQEFFETNYRQLRSWRPMSWMGRLFQRLTAADAPELVDLPTGAAKTDVVIIWILALAWYGLDRGSRKPVPRRLVWVVNRRVLVQQVFRLASNLCERLQNIDEGKDTLSLVREGLSRLSGDRREIFNFVELRGQVVDDREWSVVPERPQLIIGTVDQIGSRILFQGYGLGKWSRPLQAALLGVDAWICVDEAHLVPSFVVTLRQLRELRRTEAELHGFLTGFFRQLPWWVTELSATPALPQPKEEKVFSLTGADEKDPALAERLQAAATRRVEIRLLRVGERLEEAIVSAAAEVYGEVQTAAIFVTRPESAMKISRALRGRFGDQCLLITGRLRGYERDRLAGTEIFRRFQGNFSANVESADTSFLIGTSAAEVGLDADAARVFCDFASLPTLLQRLGRLDRRGDVSKRFREGEGEAPTMTILVEPTPVGSEVRKRIQSLATALTDEMNVLPGPLLAGTSWKRAVAKKQTIETQQEAGDSSERPKANKALDWREFTFTATRMVLMNGASEFQGGPVEAPSSWLRNPLARVTIGPTAVPPLTYALLEHWSATTTPNNRFVPAHPFLYGLLPDSEGAPLVSVAFRLEMDPVATYQVRDEDEEANGDSEDVIRRVLETFRQMPLMRSEFHTLALSKVREWFGKPSTAEVPVAVFDGDQWSMIYGGQTKGVIGPNMILVLPTSLPRGILSDLLDNDANEFSDPASDVLEGVYGRSPRYFREVVEETAGNYLMMESDGAARFIAEIPEHASTIDRRTSIGRCPQKWVRAFRNRFQIGNSTFRFDYFRREREVSRQLLTSHLQRAASDASRVAEALAPNDGAVKELLVACAEVHDLGKAHPKWQRAMGNPKLNETIAKSLWKHPMPLGGFRHEWETLLRLRNEDRHCAVTLSAQDRERWLDLWRHLIGSHHGYLRPWLGEAALDAHPTKKHCQAAMRQEAAERFGRLQGQLGPWCLAYLEALLKATDVAASRTVDDEEDDEQ